jgi:hypothetical protein
MKFTQQEEIMVARFSEQPLLAGAVERDCMSGQCPTERLL